MLVWSEQNQSICDKIFPKITPKLAFFTNWFSAKFASKIAVKLADLYVNLHLKILWNLTFFGDLSEVLHSMAQSIRPIRFENTMDRSRYKFGGKLALFIRFGTFFMEKTKQDKVERLF